MLFSRTPLLKGATDVRWVTLKRSTRATAHIKETTMFRKLTLALVAAASLGAVALAPTAASAGGRQKGPASSPSSSRSPPRPWPWLRLIGGGYGGEGCYQTRRVVDPVRLVGGSWLVRCLLDGAICLVIFFLRLWRRRVLSDPPRLDRLRLALPRGQCLRLVIGTSVSIWKPPVAASGRGLPAFAVFSARAKPVNLKRSGSRRLQITANWAKNANAPRY